ncbi:MAG: LytR C-terminal domain-containing protein [Candidatus Cyclonatronum sp.]|uniref:LytR C-terminal domain-containing protein n=1 Tax=Cyclonatronum sp. TaxID=3024185 RepID=UPI0025C623E2|nr:LytR C-terminal domain-containing protein [Cyclonatronum sp.]MCC5934960.1 LytR C-terminal domain-containing protein [Balneolales bacterium]MCH8487315.1 LytR C-terminal domain-containing protein [Cyclonatronum sp.]
MRDLLKSSLFLNAGIGAASVILLILLIALSARVVYPRVFTERTELQSHLLSNVIQVEVLNGCGVQGVAAGFTNQLRELGFDVVQSGNFETFDLAESVVIDRNGNLKNARRVALALGIDPKNILSETSPYFYLDATVVIGADYEQLLRINH